MDGEGQIPFVPGMIQPCMGWINRLMPVGSRVDDLWMGWNMPLSTVKNEEKIVSKVLLGNWGMTH